MFFLTNLSVNTDLDIHPDAKNYCLFIRLVKDVS